MNEGLTGIRAKQRGRLSTRRGIGVGVSKGECCGRLAGGGRGGEEGGREGLPMVDDER